ncbi:MULTISPECIES: undecaprenyl-diphosphate phosphatase [Acinetobacter]|uniref:Undecaprenyl-diphosphatase n=1 Tax=Acinetobacter bouvetii TaxID=202951 RepID=A0A811GCX6_9GAMM|nr:MULTISPECIES: undecaprenyl-diphosphate phosphatase [Acinetobacter]RZJ22392.1 MAG: undecaprenyl-diphosphate phosphatase [Acinetobacter sp.]EEY88777.1 undecaprenyl-diphosphatase UppP [Acinetobacter lwoffii SH145]ENX18736.1 undecaprenyl-diphosphatase 3 [Acinetobacter sp. CIP 102136]MCO8094700.1 undecaprenyl-diphosphate phosphatase [Acinetobacter lwoffii]QCO20283.1 undecaprenyl-diphosphate phosphatase [Acinetobacter cumulans]
MDIISVLKALFLGFIEGLTEFLPISSTGHLILFGHLIDFHSDSGRVFEVVIQLGAILAVCWLYRKKIINLLHGFISGDYHARRFAINVFIAFIPAVVIGVIAVDFIKQVLFSPSVVASALIIGALLIFAVEAKNFKVQTIEATNIGFKQAIVIGLVQCLAMIPGTSRSGATIIGGMLAGLSRKAATEFSFFLAIPTMLGAATYDIFRNVDVLTSENLLNISVGFVTAFIAALLVVKAMVKFVEKHTLKVFAWYRLVLGSIILFIF